MREAIFLKLIEKTLSDSQYIGDDCAKLVDEQLYVTQDTMVEGVHFDMNLTSAYLLGKKIITVNISDLCAALSTPKYVLVSISLPENTTERFVQDLYAGIDFASCKYGVKVVGGDITGSDKIVLSVCAIGTAINSRYIGRKYAIPGDVVVYCGNAGASALGLKQLRTRPNTYGPFVQAHLEPKIAFEESQILAKFIPRRVAAMDTSDGLADAIYKMSKASHVEMEIDGNAIPMLKGYMAACKIYKMDPYETILFGGEDFGLLVSISESLYSQLDPEKFVKIGRVATGEYYPVSTVTFDKKTYKITGEMIEMNCFNHFKRGEKQTSAEERIAKVRNASENKESDLH